VDRHYLAQFEIEKNGRLGDGIYVYGLEDSSFTLAVCNSIKATQGLWINRLGRDVIALLIVDYLFVDGFSNDDSLLIKQPQVGV
jgi:hypothetical protein